jgi:hypothetical protein
MSSFSANTTNPPGVANTNNPHNTTSDPNAKRVENIGCIFALMFAEDSKDFSDLVSNGPADTVMAKLLSFISVIIKFMKDNPRLDFNFMKRHMEDLINEFNKRNKKNSPEPVSDDATSNSSDATTAPESTPNTVDLVEIFSTNDAATSSSSDSTTSSSSDSTTSSSSVASDDPFVNKSDFVATLSDPAAITDDNNHQAAVNRLREIQERISLRKSRCGNNGPPLKPIRALINYYKHNIKNNSVDTDNFKEGLRARVSNVLRAFGNIFDISLRLYEFIYYIISFNNPNNLSPLAADIYSIKEMHGVFREIKGDYKNIFLTTTDRIVLRLGQITVAFVELLCSWNWTVHPNLRPEYFMWLERYHPRVYESTMIRMRTRNARAPVVPRGRRSEPGAAMNNRGSDIQPMYSLHGSGFGVQRQFYQQQYQLPVQQQYQLPVQQPYQLPVQQQYQLPVQQPYYGMYPDPPPVSAPQDRPRDPRQ